MQDGGGSYSHAGLLLKGRLMLRSKRRLEGKAIPTTEQRGAVTAFISGRAIFLLCYRVHQYLPEPGVIEKYLDLPNLSIVHQFLAVGKLSAELRAQLSMQNAITLSHHYHCACPWRHRWLNYTTTLSPSSAMLQRLLSTLL